MKTFKTLLILMITMVVLSGCSNKETSRLYFDSKPYHYLTGNSTNEAYDLLLYKVDGLNRFYLQEKDVAAAKVTEEIWGMWEDKNGILHLTDDTGRRVQLSGYRSYPHVIYTEIPKIAGAKFEVSKNIYFYKGIEKKDGYTYDFDLRLFEKGKTLPIYLVPPIHQENTFVLNVVEKKDGKVITTDEFIGYWNLKERILYLKLGDEFMHFKTERDRMELISYDNRYNLDSLHLDKVQ